MRQKHRIYQTFFICIFVGLLLWIFSPTRPFLFLQGWVERAILPIQENIYNVFHIPANSDNQQIQKLQTENKLLIKQLMDKKLLEQDNQALRDQFAQKNIISNELLPVHIIGIAMPLPDSQPTQITIDAGKADGVHEGAEVVSSEIFIGNVVRASEHLAIVLLATNSKISLPAKTLKTGALGILKGTEDGMLFDQVLLSEKLEIGDIIITRGDVKDIRVMQSTNLLIGKIVAVHKEASALFQSAKVEPLLDVTRLTMVFVKR